MKRTANAVSAEFVWCEVGVWHLFYNETLFLQLLHEYALERLLLQLVHVYQHVF